jgi:Putative transposase DNA-binding domain
MVGDNQVTHVPDPAVSGLARTRLAKSVADAGWAIRLPQERALRAGRSVVKVSRWFPSSPLCPACGFNSASMPLEVRSWTCVQCGAAHDADVNAARNILVEGRKVAAGLAQTRNARAGGAPAADLSQRLPVKPDPPRCRVSGTAGIPVIHGRQDAKKDHGRSCGRLLTGGVYDSAKDPALDAKVIADAVRHRQVASVQLGGVGLEGQQQACSWRVDQTRPAQGCAAGNRHRCPGAGDLLEQCHQVVEPDTGIQRNH